MKNGKGEYIFKDGQKYYGDWNNDKKEVQIIIKILRDLEFLII